MTLDEIATKALEKLALEAGSDDWWTEQEVKQYCNDIYRETATLLECVKSRDTTTDSVASTARYVVPVTLGSILKVTSVEYDGEQIDPSTIDELNAGIWKWRTLTAGTPFAWFFERGDENVAISFVPSPGASGTEIAIEFAYVPEELNDSDSPAEPFKNGLALLDAILSMSLAKAGGGRDLDRSDYYWSQFLSKISTFSRHKMPKTHVLGSIDESGKTAGLRLGSHYPTYTFD